MEGIQEMSHLISFSTGNLLHLLHSPDNTIGTFALNASNDLSASRDLFRVS